MGRKRGRYPTQVLKATYPHHAKDEPDRKRFFSMRSNINADSSCTDSAAEFLKNLQGTSCRITASVAKFFSLLRILTTLLTNIFGKPAKFQIFLQYIMVGTTRKALNEYKSIAGFDVCKAGFVVNNNYPCLGCNPDGLVFDKDGIITRLIEIKCPF